MLKKNIIGLIACLFSFNALADLLTFQGQYSIKLEEDAAVANQRLYDQLKEQGCPETSLDTIAPGSACDNSFTFTVWEKVRELVQTANDLCDPLDNCGPTEYSLGINLEGLGKVLRWHSAEEFSSQQTMADSFLGGQLSSLQARVNALRSGSTGFNLAGLPSSNDNNWLTLYNAEYAGLNSGDVTPKWSPWGGFLNISYSWGRQHATQLEDAYDSDGKGFNGGFDYRLNETWIIGTTFAFQRDRIDYDSQRSVVEGGVDMDAYSLIPFVLFQKTDWYALASAGYQYARFNSERGIRYNSNNLNIADVDTKTISKNTADIYTVSASTGYTFYMPFLPAFSIEPSATVNYQHSMVGEFAEKDIKNEGFNLLVKKQDFETLESIAALRVQYVFSSSVGVFVPFIDAAYHTQYRTDPHVIQATYVDAAYDFSKSTLFHIESDPAEKEYNVYTLGISFVLRGARQKTAEGPASGGLQGFISINTIKYFTNFEQNTVASGLRYEF